MHDVPAVIRVAFAHSSLVGGGGVILPLASADDEKSKRKDTIEAEKYFFNLPLIFFAMEI